MTESGSESPEPYWLIDEDASSRLAADEDLDDQVRQVIFAHAESILLASNRVRVRGAAALLDERDRVIGSLIRNPEMVGLVRKTPAGRNLIDLLTKITFALTLISAPAAICCRHSHHSFADHVGG